MNKEKFKGILIGIILTISLTLAINSSYAESIAKYIRVNYPNVKIFVNNVEITPKDAQGKTVEPFIYEGSTFLPVRAISEALGKNIDWDDKTKSVYINDQGVSKPETSKSMGPVEFLSKHSLKNNNDFVIEGNSTILVNGAKYDYNNKVFGKENLKVNYKINKNYSAIRGVILTGDKGEGMYGNNLIINGDGKTLFKGSEYLKTKGFKDGNIPKNSSNQPVEFEVNISGIDNLEIDFGYFATIFNLEFIY